MKYEAEDYIYFMNTDIKKYRSYTIQVDSFEVIPSDSSVGCDAVPEIEFTILEIRTYNDGVDEPTREQNVDFLPCELDQLAKDDFEHGLIKQHQQRLIDEVEL